MFYIFMKMLWITAYVVCILLVLTLFGGALMIAAGAFVTGNFWFLLLTLLGIFLAVGAGFLAFFCLGMQDEY
jgi:hypothetical protein